MLSSLYLGLTKFDAVAVVLCPSRRKHGNELSGPVTEDLNAHKMTLFREAFLPFIIRMRYFPHRVLPS